MNIFKNKNLNVSLIDKKIKYRNSNTFGVIISSGNDENFILEWNKKFINSKISFITIKYNGDNGEIGPFVIPGKTACNNCYIIRKNSNKFPEDFIMKNVIIYSKGIGGISEFQDLLAIYTFLELISFNLQIREPLTLNRIFSINFETFESKFHKILKVPYCEVCDMK